MTAETPTVGSQLRIDLVRASPYLTPLLVFAALAWVWTYGRSSEMGSMPGTMGMSVPSFTGMWALMMTAMMLPSATPVAVLYTRTMRSRRTTRIAAFVAGYLLVWGVSGVPAYALAWLVDRSSDETTGIALAVGVFAASGVYQLTPLKYACLAHCRTPLSHLLHYASWKGPALDLRIGIHHGGYCLACCWSLMTLMAVFGMMNLWAMIILAGIVAAEKLWSRGPLLGRAVGVVSLGLAVLVIFVPEIAPGITGTPMGLRGA